MARVLVVDDEQIILRLVADILTRAGHQVEGFPDADMAIRRGGEWDLMIVDSKLPGGRSGEDVVAAYPDVPVIRISGYDQGPVDLFKPFTAADLATMVASRLAEGRQG